MRPEPLLLPASVSALSDAARLADELAGSGGGSAPRVRAVLDGIIVGLGLVADQFDGDLTVRRRVLGLRVRLDSHLVAAEDIEAIGMAPHASLGVLRRAAADAHRELSVLAVDLSVAAP